MRLKMKQIFLQFIVCMLVLSGFIAPVNQAQGRQGSVYIPKSITHSGADLVTVTTATSPARIVSNTRKNCFPDEMTSTRTEKQNIFLNLHQSTSCFTLKISEPLQFASIHVSRNNYNPTVAVQTGPFWNSYSFKQHAASTTPAFIVIQSIHPFEPVLQKQNFTDLLKKKAAVLSSKPASRLEPSELQVYLC